MPTTANRTRRDRAAAIKRLQNAVTRTVVVTVTASKAREEFSNWINVVGYGHKWLVLKRHGKPAAAMIPVEDLKILRELEDKIDLEAARAALAQPGETPWEVVKTKLGL